MTMSLSSTLLTAIAFFLVSIVSQSFGELLILRHPPTDNGTTRKLTCISEDDDAALIWNYNFNSDPETGKRFKPKKTTSDDTTECGIWNSKQCLAEWENIGEWNAVDSAIKPMGPVFDYRWEDFREFESKENAEYRYVTNVTESSEAAIFSVRGIEDFNIFLCRDKHARRSPCHSITIGKEKGGKSAIGSCVNRAPRDKPFENTEGCRGVATVTHEFKEVLNDYEWRTFGIKWINEKKTIQVFKDTQNEPFLQGYLEHWHPVSHIITQNNRKARFRFHFYSYLLTKNKDSVMSTKKFKHDGKNFCIEMLVGLCAKCRLQIVLVGDGDRDIGTQIISGDNESVYDGMLPWKLVKLNVTSQISDQEEEEEVKLEIRTIQNEDEGEGQWAIDDIRVCKSIDSRRESTITYRKEKLNNSNDERWPEVNCQKLLYKKSSLVNSLSKSAIDPEENRLDHLLEKSLNLCGRPCKYFAKTWSLCNSMGCSCNRGYTGLDCTKKCSSGTNGYNCKKKCGSCLTGVCDVVNGYCHSGCSNSSLLPRLCKKELERPKVVKITDTSVRINVHVEPEEFEWIRSLVFEIQGIPVGESPIYPAIQTGPSTYEANITNLERQKNYTVYTVAKIHEAGKAVAVTSTEVKFTPTSAGERCFNTVTAENSLTLKYNKDLEGCDNLLGVYYSLELRELPRGQISKKTGPPLPYTFTNLQPYTEYEVSILIPGDSIYTERARTLESGPSEIRSFTVSSLSDTEATIKWEPPLQPNGVITSYAVLIKLEKLLGCESLGRPTPPEKEISRNVKDPTITLTDLHPYAKYTVTVIPRTTKEGKKRTYDIYTKQKYIPTSFVNNLRPEAGYRFLVWDKVQDCRTITGNISKTRLVFTEVTDSGKNVIHRLSTDLTRFDLSSIDLVPYTEYNVRAHVARDNDKPENLNLYQELTWWTSPAAPPAVKNFKVYDADLETKSISLRWEPPDPPNGELEFYSVSITNRNPRFEPQIIENSKKIKTCDLWENHVCLEDLSLHKDVETGYVVKVYAKNKNVAKHGNTSMLEFVPAIGYNEAPGKPVNLTETCSSHGIVNLKWSHPFSPTKITKFVIEAKLRSSTLRKYPSTHSSSLLNYRVVKKQREYSAELYLASSSTYDISITSMNRHGSNSTEYKNISTPNSFDFINEEKLEYLQNETVIRLKIPVIVNTTFDTTVNVIVKGPLNCTMNNSSQKSSSFDRRQLTVATYETGNSTPKNVTIDTNKMINEGLNCSLPKGDPYDIEIVVKDRANHSLALIVKVPINQTDNNLIIICSAIVLFVGVGSLLFIVCLRKRKRLGRRRTDVDIFPGPETTRSTDNLIALLTLRKSSRHSPEPIEDRASKHIYAVPYESDSRVVANEYFLEYVKKAAASGLLLSQYMMLPRGLTKPCAYGKLPENMPKNRDENLIAYDETRVVLEKIPGDPHSDYINASYIQVDLEKKAYIATQGPLPNTINDFWKMIWQEKVYVICMLANVIEKGKTKCEKYWPEVGIKVIYGDVSVLNTGHQVFADYTIRNFRICRQKYKRKITHLHYTGWPDNGVPMYPQSLVAYLKKLAVTPAGNGPIVVHCGTGEGRTGTIILCDICLRQAAVKKVIDVLATTSQMRESRANMVGSSQQYILAHVVITEMITSSPTQIPCTDDFEKQINTIRKRLESDVETLNETLSLERVLYSLVEPKCPSASDFARDRLPELNSAYPDVIYFERYSGSNSENGSGNYISAISIDGVRMKKQFLASQLPTTSTLSYFWRLIAKNNVELVLILRRRDPNDRSSCDIMPRRSSFAPVPYILVETRSDNEEEEHFTRKKLLLTDTSGDETRPQSVTVLTCTRWKEDINREPPTVEALVSLWRASEKVQRKEGPILVLCHDGVKGCGLYLALSFMLERMTVERECDVISAVRAVRRFRPEFVETLEQFKFLYDAAVNYFKCFETYANFS